MSFAGPPIHASVTLDRAAKRGVVLIAAAGKWPNCRRFILQRIATSSR
jgi:hypothetical protein